MPHAAGESPIPFTSLGREKRDEVFRLAGTGAQHPDAAISAAAYDWSHSPRWNTLANRIPGWVLPSVGIVLIALVAISGLPAAFVVLGILAGVLVVLFGGLGWMSTSSARRLRAVYSERRALEE